MSQAVSVAERRFDLSARLPDQVFREPAELGFAFTDSAVLTAAEGWEILKSCARYFGDDKICGVVVEDLAAETRVSAPPSLKVEADSTRELYINWLDQEEAGSHSPLYIDARVIAFAGSSGKWGIWIDQDTELAVLGAPASSLASIVASTQAAFPWLPARAVADILAPSFHPEPVSPEMVARLYRAYGESSSALPNP